MNCIMSRERRMDHADRTVDGVTTIPRIVYRTYSETLEAPDA